MRIRTLVILAILFFAVGSILGGGYAFFYHIGGDTKAHVASTILPTPKTDDEKMIDDFIEKQEQKQQGTQEPAWIDEKKNDDSKEISTNDNEKNNNEDDSKDNNIAGSGRIGRPTVSDGKTLNVRTEPSTEGDVLLGIPNTEEVIINKTQDNWYNITTSNGTKGWVSAEYMEIVE